MYSISLVYFKLPKHGCRFMAYDRNSAFNYSYVYFSVQCPIVLMFNSVFTNHCLRSHYSHDFKYSSKHILCLISAVLLEHNVLGKLHPLYCEEDNENGGGMKRKVKKGDYKGTTYYGTGLDKAGCHRRRHKTEDHVPGWIILERLVLRTV